MKKLRSNIQLIRLDRERGNAVGQVDPPEYCTQPPPDQDARIRAHAERVAREEHRHPSEQYHDSRAAGRGSTPGFRERAARCCARALEILCEHDGCWTRKGLAIQLSIDPHSVRRYLATSDWFSRPRNGGGGGSEISLTEAGRRAAKRLKH